MSDNTDARAREMADEAIDGYLRGLLPPSEAAHFSLRIRNAIAPLLAARAQAERERDEARGKFIAADEDAKISRRFMEHSDRRAEAAEARAAALRKALEEIEALLGLDNPSVIAVRAFQVAREALAADQAGGEEANISDARERLAAAPCDDVELPIGGEADKRIAAIARDWKDPALTPQPPQSEAGTVPGGPRMTLNSPPTRPELLALMEATRKSPPMTAEQIRAQRRSWVRGEMGLAHPDMSDAEINRILDEVDPAPAAAPSPPSGEDRVKALEEALRWCLDVLADRGVARADFDALLARQP